MGDLSWFKLLSATSSSMEECSIESSYNGRIKRDWKGIVWCYSRFLGEIGRSTCVGLIVPMYDTCGSDHFYRSPCLSLYTEEGMGYKSGGFLYLGILAFVVLVLSRSFFAL